MLMEDGEVYKRFGRCDSCQEVQCAAIREVRKVRFIS